MARSRGRHAGHEIGLNGHGSLYYSHLYSHCAFAKEGEVRFDVQTRGPFASTKSSQLRPAQQASSLRR